MLTNQVSLIVQLKQFWGRTSPLILLHSTFTCLMEYSIIRQLETVEEEMLAADGSSALAVFTERWTTLLQDINQASQAGHLSRETQALVFQTASMVNTLAESFLEFERTHIALSVQFKDDMQEIYARVCFISRLV